MRRILIQEGVRLDDILEVIDAMAERDFAARGPYSLYGMVSNYNRYKPKEELENEKSSLKTGDIRQEPRFRQSIELQSPAAARYGGATAQNFLGDFYFHNTCSRLLRVLLEVAVNWVARDLLADMGFIEHTLTGDEGLLGPRARAVEALGQLWSAILSSPALMKAMSGPRGFMSPEGHWQHFA